MHQSMHNKDFEPVLNTVWYSWTLRFEYFDMYKIRDVQWNIWLKGQCHEIVIEMSPWSSSLGLNYWSQTLFSVKKSAVLKQQSIE
jgi:hypothetical protein